MPTLQLYLKAGEKQSVKDTAPAKRLLGEAKSDLAKFEREQAEASQVDATREQELQKQLHLLQFEKETHLGEIESIA